jgi:hypothetical protein
LNIKIIPIESIHPAVHGIGAILVLLPEGVGVALVAYSKVSGVLGGILQTYSGGPPDSDACDRQALSSLLSKADWIMAHGAREAKAGLIKSLPEVERKPWVCTFGILERNPGTAQPLVELLPESKGPYAIMPEPLEWTLGYLDLLLQNGRISKALYRAGITTSNI